MKTKLVVTLGNPNGIGPEVTARALSLVSPELASSCLIVGDKESVRHYFTPKQISDYVFRYVEPSDAGIDYAFEPGGANFASGLMSLAYLDAAIRLVKENNYPALVTAPLSKELIAGSGREDVKHFKGHTDYLAEAFGVKKYSMLFYSRDINVLLATIHIPLSEVPVKLTEEKVDIAVENSVLYCERLYPGDYRIGVCGLNPHAGEHGLLGHEDDEVILPVVERWRAKGYPVDGPLPADTAFYKAYRERKYRLLVAMYHDQGLAPFKLLHFIDGVNATVGLPIVRTSPDHGTAFDIAGKGVADPNSMKSSLELAWEWIKDRN